MPDRLDHYEVIAVARIATSPAATMIPGDKLPVYQHSNGQTDGRFRNPQGCRNPPERRIAVAALTLTGHEEQVNGKLCVSDVYAKDAAGHQRIPLRQIYMKIITVCLVDRPFQPL